jgi:hypothetical protein
VCVCVCVCLRAASSGCGIMCGSGVAAGGGKKCRARKVKWREIVRLIYGTLILASGGHPPALDWRFASEIFSNAPCTFFHFLRIAARTARPINELKRPLALSLPHLFLLFWSAASSVLVRCPANFISFSLSLSLSPPTSSSSTVSRHRFLPPF